ncbi:tyrosine-type recombinase/integrase [Paraburkholderia sp. UCT2]|uniref:tyrosine-type recombinase/integrase n=1 Tax=Paraburkholderia sp. UCT2 TaxID=2615208 RepID=UPI003976E660|nr:tyrosine-type recombinase/integrase [Paraburkholderia sp. UCT2]
MRLGEVRNLELEDVDLKTGVLTICGTKFGKSRLVPLHVSTCKVLAAYIARRERYWAGRTVSSYVFASNRGNRLDNSEIHRAFYRLSRPSSRSAGVFCADPARASHSQQALHPHARQLPDSPGDRRTPCRARSTCLVRPT